LLLTKLVNNGPVMIALLMFRADQADNLSRTPTTSVQQLMVKSWGGQR
jgi:hypothetical protein